MFSFSYDANRALLNIVQRGYWSIEEFRDYESQYLAHHHAILRNHSSYRVIADCRDYPVQSPEVSQAFEALFRTLTAENGGHSAVIVASMLNRLQARRVMPQDNVRMFAGEEWEDAMQWVFGDGSLP